MPSRAESQMQRDEKMRLEKEKAKTEWVSSMKGVFVIYLGVSTLIGLAFVLTSLSPMKPESLVLGVAVIFSGVLLYFLWPVLARDKEELK